MEVNFIRHHAKIYNMPSYPPRNQPIRKIEIFEKRIFELQKSKKANASEAKIKTKIEKLRTAKLNLIKARLALLDSYRAEDENESKFRLIKDLKTEYTKWELLPASWILDVFCD